MHLPGRGTSPLKSPPASQSSMHSEPTICLFCSGERARKGSKSARSSWRDFLASGDRVSRLPVASMLRATPLR